MSLQRNCPSVCSLLISLHFSLLTTQALSYSSPASSTLDMHADAQPSFRDYPPDLILNPLDRVLISSSDPRLLLPTKTSSIRFLYTSTLLAHSQLHVLHPSPPNSKSKSPFLILFSSSTKVICVRLEATYDSQAGIDSPLLSDYPPSYRRRRKAPPSLPAPVGSNSTSPSPRSQSNEVLAWVFEPPLDPRLHNIPTHPTREKPRPRNLR